jgi:hypothetical protein
MLPVQIKIIPKEQDGLKFDPNNFSIVGKPTRTGVYLFNMAVTNGVSTTAPRELQINVSINQRDKPRFKSNNTLASAMPEKEYSLNLLDLIEPIEGFGKTNQVNFSIDLNKPHPHWLNLDKNNPNVLYGKAPSSAAGQMVELTLMATSNTGGDSEKATIYLPIAYDPANKPRIDKGIELTGTGGSMLFHDFRHSIQDPTNDSKLKIVIDNIEPKATWLMRSSSNLTEITGEISENEVGQTYKITVHANTTTGGDSDPMIIPLKIAINKDKTPRFYQENPQLPLFYEGQSSEHDFVANNDIYPEYHDIPYTIELANDENNPSWVRVENNKLIVDEVPGNIDPIVPVFIRIKNKPGGASKFTLKLMIIN